jgi:hypothetical protein
MGSKVHALLADDNNITEKDHKFAVFRPACFQARRSGAKPICKTFRTDDACHCPPRGVVIRLEIRGKLTPLTSFKKAVKRPGVVVWPALLFEFGLLRGPQGPNWPPM